MGFVVLRKRPLTSDKGEFNRPSGCLLSLALVNIYIISYILHVHCSYLLIYAFYFKFTSESNHPISKLTSRCLPHYYPTVSLSIELKFLLTAWDNHHTNLVDYMWALFIMETLSKEKTEDSAPLPLSSWALKLYF